ncbi:MAG TPA: helix-turn-helix domain-containing protein [Myxococcales bacterium]|nr:helix-turn-helix domain-containing protein [Myxococcales bacterium]
MGRPRLIEDDAILAAAREVFLSRGAAATTQDVAERVGLSQAAIFKRFATKQELFLAAMVSGNERQDLIERFQKRAAATGLRPALIGLGDDLLPFFRRVLPLLLLSWSNRSEFGFPKAMTMGNYPPNRAVQEVVAVIAAEMRARRLRKHDPWLVTRAFVGGLQNYVLFELFAKGTEAACAGDGRSASARGFGGLAPPVYPPKEYVRGLVDILWKGIAPPAAASAARALKEQE